MSRRVFSRAATMLGALFLSCLMFVTPANAAAATGWTSVTAASNDQDGVRYYNTSSIYSPPDSSRLYASTRQWTTTGAAVPAGRMGVLATLWIYGPDGMSYICDEEGYYYTASSATTFSVPTLNDCGSGNYYSRGVVQTFTGSFYISQYTFPTVNITY